MLRQTIGGIRLISALTVELDGAQIKLCWASISHYITSNTNAIRNKWQLAGFIELFSIGWCFWGLFFKTFWTLHIFWLLFNIPWLFQPVATRDRSQMPSSAGGRLERLQGEEVCIQNVWPDSPRSAGVWLDMSWRSLKRRSEPFTVGQSSNLNMPNPVLRFIVFVCLLSHFFHDSLLRFAPSGLALLSGCLFWREKLRFITAMPILHRHVQQGKS